MKLCPQCEFLYEDDQNLCDMDGEALVYDTRLGALPCTLPTATSARPTKLRLRIIALPVAAGLVISALLFVAYSASSPLLNSNFASPGGKSVAPQTSLQRQIAPLPDNSSSQPTASPATSPANTAAESKSIGMGTDEPMDKPASESTRSQAVPKATNNTSKSTDDRLAIARGVPPLPRLMPLPRLLPPNRLMVAQSEAKTSGSTPSQKPEPTNQQSAVVSQKALIVEVKPAGANTKKQSGMSGFLKKTARVLKKPFKF